MEFSSVIRWIGNHLIICVRDLFMITEFGGIVQLVKNIWLTSRRSVVRIHLPLQNAPVAQLAEHSTFNAGVLGSNPSRRTKLFYLLIKLPLSSVW